MRRRLLRETEEAFQLKKKGSKQFRSFFCEGTYLHTYLIEILHRYRTDMLAQVLQIFLGKEHLVKNWLISTLYKLIYFK
jgi:hypothetical protein